MRRLLRRNNRHRCKETPQRKHSGPNAHRSSVVRFGMPEPGGTPKRATRNQNKQMAIPTVSRKMRFVLSGAAFFFLIAQTVADTNVLKYGRRIVVINAVE